MDPGEDLLGAELRGAAIATRAAAVCGRSAVGGAHCGRDRAAAGVPGGVHGEQSAVLPVDLGGRVGRRRGQDCRAGADGGIDHCAKRMNRGSTYDGGPSSVSVADGGNSLPAQNVCVFSGLSWQDAQSQFVSGKLIVSQLMLANVPGKDSTFDVMGDGTIGLVYGVGAEVSDITVAV